MGNKKDIFKIIVPLGKLSPKYKTLLEYDGYYPARCVIREVFEKYYDKDGNFIEQFQSTGFDTRIWELYLFAYLSNNEFSIDFRYDRPDFIATKNQMPVCIEAVTSNPTQ